MAAVLPEGADVDADVVLVIHDLRRGDVIVDQIVDHDVIQLGIACARGIVKKDTVDIARPRQEIDRCDLLGVHLDDRLLRGHVGLDTDQMPHVVLKLLLRPGEHALRLGLHDLLAVGVEIAVPQLKLDDCAVSGAEAPARAWSRM